MNSLPNQPTTQIDQELVGEPIQVGAYTLQPVARARGRLWSAPEWRRSGRFRATEPDRCAYYRPEWL